ncbi:MAG: 4-deoxy-4-formamido-L-arabinose-phosphoundecaprenol deformylase [Betaproteobacteria bacterium]
MRMIEVLKRHDAGATFLFSLGPDHTGRAIRRVFRPGFFSKVQRTSVVSHYGVRTLLNGTLLPGPDIGRRCADVLRYAREQGFEVGIHCWDHVRWQDFMVCKPADWVEREMERAFARFRELFGEEARTWGAAGWQTSRYAAWIEELRCDYASDTRGRGPFLPLWNGVRIGCPQLPTTLPTLDELIGRVEDPVACVLNETGTGTDHVFTAHAEIEGGRLIGELERLLEGWKRHGYRIVSTRSLYESLEVERLPRCEVVYGEVPGRSGTLALQGDVR